MLKSIYKNSPFYFLVSLSQHSTALCPSAGKIAHLLMTELIHCHFLYRHQISSASSGMSPALLAIHKASLGSSFLLITADIFVLLSLVSSAVSSLLSFCDSTTAPFCSISVASCSNTSEGVNGSR